MPFIAGSSQSVVLLAASTLGGAAASIDVQNIPSGYGSLLVTVTVKSAVADTAAVRINNDSGNNYGTCTIHNTGSVVTGTNQSATSSFKLGQTATDKFALFEVLIQQDAANVKSLSSHGGVFTLQDITNGYNASVTAEINRLTFFGQGGQNFAAGTRIQIFGLKGT